MFSHIMLGADDVAASKTFYDAALGALGVRKGWSTPKVAQCICMEAEYLCLSLIHI